MALVGVTITSNENQTLTQAPTLYVEYHRCDDCSAEFRYVFKTEVTFREALDTIVKKMGSNGKRDLCHNCATKEYGEQALLELG